jgi:hypothetical protein
MLKSC